jgi:micrococcal nuclease
VSKPWKPPSRDVELSGTVVVVVLAAAACAGLAVGLGQVPRPRESLEVDASASAPVTANFDYCQWGGGTNCVVDGDTFWIGGEKVRIAGIDAPETHPSRCAYEARLGNAATERLHALLNSGAVTMTNIDRDRDVYGRLLRNVQVDGADVGEAMVSAGVAREYGSGRRPWC